MFTILKIHERLSYGGDAGWYQKPPGTVATEAAVDELRGEVISG